MTEQDKGRQKYGVTLMIQREMVGDPDWNEIDDGQEAGPVDAALGALMTKLEDDGWDVDVMSVEKISADGEDESNEEAPPDSDEEV